MVYSRFGMNNAEANYDGPMRKPCWNSKEGRIGSVSRCRWCAATATLLLAVRVCSVCKGEGGEFERLVSIILRARPVRWVSLRLTMSELALSDIPTLACTRGPGALKPSSSGLSQI